MVEKNLKKKKRKEWVDVLRSIAMMLVIYGHRVSGWNEYFVFTSPIKIPLFFAITGYVFNDANGDFKVFLRKLWRTIIVPWIIIGGLPYLVAIPIRGWTFFATKIMALLTGDTYWYMPCCIIAEIIWFFLLKYFKSTRVLGVLTVVLFGIGIELFKCGILSVFLINRAVSVQIFLYIGYLFNCYEKPVFRIIREAKPIITGTVIYLVIGILSLVLYPGQCLDVHLCIYYNVFLCLLMILVGNITLTILIRNKIKKYPGWLTKIGQNTPIIYRLHGYLSRTVIKVFNIIHIPVNWVTSIFLTFVVCSAGMEISALIHRFLPELMGKSRTVPLKN
jgi:fucose 4-O-acetylase-like acetyltransferase